MIIHLDQSLGKLVAVNIQKPLVQLVRNSHVRVADVFESVQENLVGILVVTEVLLLRCNVDRNSNGLTNVSNSSVKLEGPLGLFWRIISLTH